MPVPEDVEVIFPNDGGCFGCSPTHPSELNLVTDEPIAP